MNHFRLHIVVFKVDKNDPFRVETPGLLNEREYAAVICAFQQQYGMLAL